MVWWEPQRIQGHMTDVTMWITDRRVAPLAFALWYRSALCCSTSSLMRSRWPPAADNRTAVQPYCGYKIDTCTISPCLYVTYYTFHSTSVSVDQIPQWFLLHQYWNIKTHSLKVLTVDIGLCTLTLSSSTSKQLNSSLSNCTTSAWPKWAARNRAVKPHCARKRRNSALYMLSLTGKGNLYNNYTSRKQCLNSVHVQFDNTSSENVLGSMEVWRPLLELKLQQRYSSSYVTQFCIQLMKALWPKHLAFKWLLILMYVYA